MPSPTPPPPRRCSFRHRAADDLFTEHDTTAARQRFHIQDHVAELAVAAGLFFVTSALGHGLADGFLITDRRRVLFHADAETVLQALDRDAQMHFPPHSTISWVSGLWTTLSEDLPPQDASTPDRV
jgi:hypothetical protein